MDAGSERGRQRKLAARIRGRLSYANVAATIALFGVLAGGGAYAASQIGPKDIAKNAVRAKHIKKKQVKAKHVAKNAVRTKHIRDGAVSEAKLAEGVAVSGPQGPQGPPGPATGPAGGDLTGSYPNPTIAAGAVSSSKLADGAVGAQQLGELPGASVWLGSDQTVSHATGAPIGFASEIFDHGNLHSAAQPERIVANVPGTWLVTLRVSFRNDADGVRREAYLRPNQLCTGVGHTEATGRAAINGGSAFDVVNVTHVLELDAGEFVSGCVHHDAGNDLDIVGSFAGKWTYMAMQLLSG